MPAIARRKAAFSGLRHRLVHDSGQQLQPAGCRADLHGHDRVELGLQGRARIQGDTAEVVVIKTDPGYGPDPDQPGTGTIVALLCP